jgi:hypothetical protein
MQPLAGSFGGPLKVRERKQRVWAETTTGATIIDGSTRVHPDVFSAAGPSGMWRIAGTVEHAGTRYHQVLDPSGAEAARIDTTDRKRWLVRLPAGETAEVSSRGSGLTGFSCTIGTWSTAKTPILAPQRYFTLTLSDATAGRPDRELIAVVATWVSESTIAMAITNSNS